MKRFFFLLLIPLALVWPQDISVEQERRSEIIEDTRQVVVSGIGMDRDSAVKQGLRTAMEQVQVHNRVFAALMSYRASCTIITKETNYETDQHIYSSSTAPDGFDRYHHAPGAGKHHRPAL